jgi:hypothetical protein
MRIYAESADRREWLPVLRRILEFGFAVGAALLCSYWIVGGHW